MITTYKGYHGPNPKGTRNFAELTLRISSGPSRVHENGGAFQVSAYKA